MKRCVEAFMLAFCAVAQGASEGYSSATYGYEDDGKTYVATVEAGKTATLADGDDAAAVLNGGAVEKFVKRGDGMLKVSADLSSFAGDLHVEDGVYSSSPAVADAPNTTAGKPGVEYKIVVASGATFDFDTAVSGHTLSREWHFSGRGHEDAQLGELGALHTTESGTAMSAVKGKVVLDGATMMRYTRGNNFSFIDCPMDMQKYDLTLKSDARSMGPIIQCNNFGESFMGNAGNVFVEGCANISGYLSWLYCDPIGNRTLTVEENSTLILNSMSQTENLATAYHNVVLKKGANIKLQGGNDKVFYGSVTFEDPKRNIISSTSPDERYRINLRGRILGSGFSARGNVAVELRDVSTVTAFANATTNGVEIQDGAFVDLRSTGTALLNVTETGGDISVSNGTLCAGYTFYSFEKLGAVSFAGNCTWAVYAYFNYDSPGSVVSGDSNRTATKFSNLHFIENPTVAFSTNVVTGALHGLGSVSNTVDVADARKYSYEKGTATRCDNFKIQSSWTFGLDDVLSGGCLASGGRIDFDSGAVIRLEGCRRLGGASRSFLVAYAEDGINGLDESALEVDDSELWRLSAGADGKTLYAVYTPKGTVMIVR